MERSFSLLPNEKARLVNYVLTLRSLMIIVFVTIASISIKKLYRKNAKHAAKSVLSWRMFHPLGYAVEYGTDWRKFVDKYSSVYGSVFRCRIAMKSFTFVNDHRLLTKMMQKNNVFRFDLIFMDLKEKVFQLSSPFDLHPRFHSAAVKYLSGDKLERLSERYVFFFQQIMSASYNTGTWLEINGKTFIDHLVFAGSSRAAIGDFDDNIISSDLKRHFDNFDNNIHLISAGIPECFLSSIRESQTYVTNYLATLPEEKESEFMEVVDWVCENMDVYRPKLLFLMLWAVNANSQPAIFWTLMFLLRDPHAMELLKEEAETVVKEETGWVADTNAGTTLPPLPASALMKMKGVHSYILDCIRIQSSYMALRQMSRDHLVELKTGEKFQFYKGDIIMGCNQHHRSDIFPEPMTPKVDRFIRNGNLFRDEFGNLVSSANLSFGMGKDLCPGKQFFLHEATCVVATLLLAYDVELKAPETPVPPPNMTRVGLGCMSLHPSYENDASVWIRIKRKSEVL